MPSRLTVQVNGTEYEVIGQNFDGYLLLRLWGTEGNSYYGIKAPDLAENEQRVLTLMEELAHLGDKALIKVNDSGQLESQHPTTYLADLANADVGPTPNQTTINSAINTVVSKLNAVLAALRTQTILQKATVSITPDPATCILSTLGPTTIVPAPVTMRLSVGYNVVSRQATFVLGAQPPIVSTPYIPSPVTLILRVIDPTVTIA